MAKKYAPRFAQGLSKAGQLGIGQSAAPEAITHAVRAALAKNPGYIALQLDFSNAYNTVSRALIVRLLQRDYPELLPYFMARYGVARRLTAPMLGEQHDVWLECGIQQGDPLGPFFFALALNAALAEDPEFVTALPPTTRDAAAMDTGSDVALLLAYLDDIVIVGTPEQVAERMHRLAHALEQTGVGLTLNATKCVTWSLGIAPDARTLPMQQFAQQLRRVGLDVDSLDNRPCGQGGIVLLGAAIGTDEYCEAHLDDVIAETREILEAIARIDSKQVQLILLRYCAADRATFSLRVSPPSITGGFAREHDSAIVGALAGLQGFRAKSPLWDTLVSLPTRQMGGMGLRSAQQTANLAYLASVADGTRLMLSSEATRVAFASVSEDVKEWLTSPTSAGNDVMHIGDVHTGLAKFHDCVEDFIARLEPGYALPSEEGRLLFPSREAASLQTLEPKLQRRLQLVDNHIVEFNLRRSMPPAALALHVSHKQPGASAILDAIPSCSELKVENNVLCHFLRKYQCVDILDGMTDACGPEHDFAELCNNGDCHKLLHDHVCNKLGSVLSSAGLHVTRRYMIGGAVTGRVHDEAPDLECLHMPVPNAVTDIDVMVKSPLGRNVLQRAQHTPLTAASDGERTKVAKYRDYVVRYNHAFEPAVFESTGAFGRQVQSILHRADTAAPERWAEDTDNARTWKTPTFKSFAYQTLAIAFWQGDVAKARRHQEAHAAPDGTAVPAALVTNHTTTTTTADRARIRPLRIQDETHDVDVNMYIAADFSDAETAGEGGDECDDSCDESSL
jgi:hypothetical protein